MPERTDCSMFKRPAISETIEPSLEEKVSQLDNLVKMQADMITNLADRVGYLERELKKS